MNYNVVIMDYRMDTPDEVCVNILRGWLRFSRPRAVSASIRPLCLSTPRPLTAVASSTSKQTARSRIVYLDVVLNSKAEPMGKQYFSPATFKFLRDLAANNDRKWMADHKHRYIDEVQEPALEFIDDFRSRLRAISPHFRADARTVGGSLFRIHRDTRFAKDKTPYKENTGVQFRHEMAKDAHAPGFYLHIQPRECFIGVGLWRPETKVAYQIRQTIADGPDAWIEASRNEQFATTFALGGDSLVRPPKGFDADNPLIDDLKRKDFIASSPLTQKTVTSPSFIDEFDEMCQNASKFMSFLCSAVGVPY